MRKILSFILSVVLIITISGCNEERYDIVTTLFPHYDFALNIVGNKMSVKLLTRPGTEAHDYEPVSNDFILIEHAKLFIFTGKSFDAHFLSEQIINNTNSMNMESNIDIHEDEHDDHDHGIHYWTNIKCCLEMLDAIYERVILIDPDNQEYYFNNYSSYKDKIEDESDAFLSYLSDKENKTIFYTGHNALEPFADYFHLEIIPVTSGKSPDADITSRELLNIVNKIRDSDTRYLFKAELTDMRIADTIKNELGDDYFIQVFELHGYHNISLTDYDNKVTYLDLLIRNIGNLKKAIK